MAKEKTVYVTDDGTQFDSQQEAENYEVAKGIRLRRPAEVMKRLQADAPRGWSEDFVSGYRAALNWVMNRE